MNWHLHFLGVGAAHAVELVSSAVVLERAGVPLLLIDCGPDTLDRYMAVYDALPPAVFITHTHMDHVAGLEQLFIRLWFDPHLRGTTRVFVHAALMPWLPSARVLMEHCAWLAVTGTAMQPGSGPVPSWNSTVPVGALPLTVAVKVTLCPSALGLALDTRAVVLTLTPTAA